MSRPPFEASAETATIDRVCSLLATDTCRAVLAYFDASTTQTASLDDLTEYVATRQPNTRTRERVQLRLHHVGLPKLEGAGFVDYDVRTATVRYRGRDTAADWGALVAAVMD